MFWRAHNNRTKKWTKGGANPHWAGSLWPKIDFFQVQFVLEHRTSSLFLFVCLFVCCLFVCLFVCFALFLLLLVFFLSSQPPLRHPGVLPGDTQVFLPGDAM